MFAALDPVANHLHARWNSLSPGQKLGILWLTPGVPPPGPFGAEEVRMTMASAYVENSCLYIVGMAKSALGPIPFSYRAPLAAEVPNGPIDLTHEDHPEPIVKAAQEARPAIQSMIAGEQMKLGARDLVERSRSGDQNAEDLLGVIAKAAAKGEPKARRAKALVMQYIKMHPVADADDARSLPGRASAGPFGAEAVVGHCPCGCHGEFGSAEQWRCERRATFGGEGPGDRPAARSRFGIFGAEGESGGAVKTLDVTTDAGGTTAVQALAAAAQSDSPLRLGAAVTSVLPAVGGNVGASITAASAIAAGKTIDGQTLGAIANALPVDPVPTAGGRVAMPAAIFATGVKNSHDRCKIQALAKGLPVDGKRALQAGFVLGTAKRIQDAAAGRTFLSDLAAWELG